VREALYGDYLVLQKPDGQCKEPNVPAAFIEHVLVSCGKPAVVLPKGAAIHQLPRTVAIAWTETREAARAVAGAMPFLRDAMKVHIIGCGDDAYGAVPALAGRLEAHGVPVEQHYLEGAGTHAGHAVIERATRLGVDLLVLGGYGHGPTRELLVGGVSRTVLDTMPLPVLMAH
jgi:nucleotide-binding universal stress UspA family protein